MKKLAYIFMALVGFCKYSYAQTGYDGGRQQFLVGYEISIPTNSNYLTKTSWDGVRFDYRYMVTPNVGFDLGVSYNSFQQYFPEQTYQRPDGTGAVTSDMIRQVYSSPITAGIVYYFKASSTIKPYIGLGLGTQYSEQNAYFNIYSVSATNWGFVVRPEIGFTAQIDRQVGFFASGAFNYATNSNDAFHIDHLSQFPITVGLIFKVP